jgi:hypothetical protein
VKVFVHGGFHKTGTTSFQAVVKANAARARPGLLLLTTRLPVMRRLNASLHWYHRWPHPLLLRGVERRIADLRREVDACGADTVLISMESLCGKMPDGRGGAALYPSARPVLEALARAFADHPPTLLFSTREPAAWVRSVHGHRVKTRGLAADFERFAASPAMRDVDWGREIAAATAGLGLPVVVSRLEDTAGQRLGPCSDFLALADPDPHAFDAWVSPGPRNVALTRQAIEFARRPWLRLLPAFARRRLVRRFDARVRAVAAGAPPRAR